MWYNLCNSIMVHVVCGMSGTVVPCISHINVSLRRLMLRG
jgi:hypothetical protein